MHHASITRGEGLRLARREIAKDRNSVPRVMLALLKVLVLPRTEEILTSEEIRGLNIDCRAGCNACYYQNVEVSIPEAILVSLQLANPGDLPAAGEKVFTPWVKAPKRIPEPTQ